MTLKIIGLCLMAFIGSLAFFYAMAAFTQGQLVDPFSQNAASEAYRFMAFITSTAALAITAILNIDF